MFESLLNPVFLPLLKLPALLAVVIISAIVSVIITVIYKYTTNQDLMKQLKSELKEFQKEMKELKQHPEKMMAVQKKAMQTNMKYMGHSMRSTLITFIPIILIFSWMSAHFAYDPIMPNQEFTTTAIFEEGYSGDIELIVLEGILIEGGAIKEVKNGEATWLLKGDKGEHILEYKFNGNSEIKDIIITNEQAYKTPVKKIKDSSLKEIRIDNKKKIVMNLFGWKLGWLGTYIIISIIFSMLLRKVMKVY